MPSTSSDARTTARRILNAAAKLLATEGYASLSMRRVAASVGISQAAIYRHFKDKAELVSKLVGEGYGELSAMIERVAERDGPPEKLIASSFRDYVEFAVSRPALFKALLLQDIGTAGKTVEAFATGVSRRRRTFELLTAMIGRGMDEGVFTRADPELTAQAIWASFFGLASRVVIEGLPADRRGALVERQIELVIRGLRA